jgi:putative flippase GtrA
LRLRQLVHESSKFLVVGCLGAVVTVGGAVALNDLGKYVAVTLATIAATAVTFLGNRYWTFRHRQGRGTAHETTVFFILNGVGLLIYYGCIGLMQDVMGLDGKLWYTIALVIGTALGTVFRFWSYRKWVWIEHPGMAAGYLPERLEPALAGSVPIGRGVSHRDIARLEPAGSVPRHAGGRRAPAGRTTISRSHPGAHRRS